MTASVLTFNILTFNHPSEEYSFFFYKDESDNLQRVHKNLVPKEVMETFGEQEHYYMSFDINSEGALTVTKKSKPVSHQLLDEHGKEFWKKEENSAFSKSILKRYYNRLIHNYFESLGCLVKPNFVNDVEVWVREKCENDDYAFFMKFTIKVQIARITNQPELLISYEGKSKLFKNSVEHLMDRIAPEHFNWVVFEEHLFHYEKLTQEGKRNLQSVFPVWNFDIRNDLQQRTAAPERGNRYINYLKYIKGFIRKFLNTEGFCRIIPLTSGDLVRVNEAKMNSVSDSSNQLLFYKKKIQVVPKIGMKEFGPYDIPATSKIHFFFIYHVNDRSKVDILHEFFTNGLENFKGGILGFIKTPYFTQKNFSIAFKDKNDPLPEIREALSSPNRSFDPDIKYIAIYMSPHSKTSSNTDLLSIYYKVKELLLHKDITSQAIDANKVSNDPSFQYSLINIAIAILAKLNGTPWRLNTILKNELIVGVGAFQNRLSNVRYIGSAFSFSNNGRFNKFDCFKRNQTDELAGSIIQSIKDYVSYSNNPKRLIIHYYKDMSDKEFEPIEKGLNSLGLDNIPVFIVAINKTESNDIVAFDNDYKELMPHSGTFINVGFNKFLLFNNTRYNGAAVSKSDGFPFPIKIGITCNYEDQAKDIKIIRELIEQVYQFSRMYWKSIRQQNLPVTIKYPEMVAEIFPHFDGNEIPDFGKDNLWFL